jgi:hypothetical protein
MVLASLTEEWKDAEAVMGSPEVREWLERHGRSAFAQRLTVATLNGLAEDGLAQVWHDGTQRMWRLRP